MERVSGGCLGVEVLRDVEDTVESSVCARVQCYKPKHLNFDGVVLRVTLPKGTAIDMNVIG